MPGETSRPLSSWSRPVLAAVGRAFRDAYGRHDTMPPCYAAAEAAFVAAGGDPVLAKRDVALIVAALARDHPDWLYGPCRARIAREEAWWKACGIWPPPKGRREWPADAPR